MPGLGEINGSQPFKLTIESYRTNNVANGGARANAPAALNNAEPAAAPQPAVAQAQQPRRSFFAWIMSWFRRAEPAPAPEPRVAAPQVPPHKQFNDGILATLKVNDFAALPQSFKDVLNALEGTLRAKFGANIVREGLNLCNLLSSAKCQMTRFSAVVEAANAAGREITLAELVDEYTARANQLFVKQLIGERFAEMCGAENVALGGTPLSQGALMAKRHPEIAQELCACNTSAEVAQVLDRHAAKFSALVETRRAINEAMAAAEDSCHERLATALGMNKCLVSSMVETVLLTNDIMDSGNQMLVGTFPGCKEPGFNAKAALKKLSDDFVNDRMGYLAEIDSLNIDDGAKQRWKASVLNARSLPVLRPAQVMQLAGAVNLRKLEGALGDGIPVKLKCDIFTDLNRELREALRTALGEQAYNKLGAEDFVVLTSLAEDAALFGKPALMQKIKDAKETLKNEVFADMSLAGNTGGATFVSSLVGLTLTTAENPLTTEPRLAEAVEKQVDAALAKSGISNARIIADVKAALVAQGKNVLKGATTLAALSAFVDSVKGQAQVLAKTLDAVASTRESGKNLIATTVALSTGLGKAYVLNTIDTSSITSASGKLRFLYDDIMSKAKKGPVDYVAVVNKANKIVTDFANDKIAMLKAIDAAGFDPADRADYTMKALKDSNWRDAGVVSLAKVLAGNANIKAAFKALAGVRGPDHAASIAVKGIVENFRLFAQTFSHEILSNHPDMARKMVDSSDVQQLLQMMATSLLAKEMPEMSAFLARLAEAGRLAEVGRNLSDAMNAMRALKMDYMTLEQYNLKGPPNNEPIRSVMRNPNLAFDQAKFTKCINDDATLNIANTFFVVMTSDFPTNAAFKGADKYIARKQVGGVEMRKYANGLPPEAVPILNRLVDRLDWRPDHMFDSDKIVREFVEDLRNWRDIVPGSEESKGLEDVLQRRMNAYMIDVINGQTQSSGFDKVGGADVLTTFTQDLSRIRYVLNGSVLRRQGAPEMLGELKKALGNDPAKLKTLSVIANQQIFGELSSAVSNRMALAGWKPGQDEEELSNIPNIEKFASRDITKTGFPFFDTGDASFEIDVAPDGKSAKIRARCESPMRGAYTLMEKGKDVGKCIITQEFTLEFGDRPVIKDLKIGQTLV